MFFSCLFNMAKRGCIDTWTKVRNIYLSGTLNTWFMNMTRLHIIEGANSIVDIYLLKLSSLQFGRFNEMNGDNGLYVHPSFLIRLVLII